MPVLSAAKLQKDPHPDVFVHLRHPTQCPQSLKSRPGAERWRDEECMWGATIGGGIGNGRLLDTQPYR